MDRRRPGSRLVEGVTQDVRYAIRTLAHAPGYTLLVVLTLSLGIGANTAIFSVINGVLLQPLPYRHGQDLVLARQQAPLSGAENIPFSVKEIIDYREHLSTLDGLVEYHGMAFTLLNRGEPDRVLTGVVSSNFFDVLGVDPLLGRTFVDADDDLGAEAVLVLSYPYWLQKFGGDPGIVGQIFQMNDRPHTVVGVLPPIPQYPRENDVYMPTSACPFRAAGERRMEEDRTAFRSMTAFGRLRTGATPEGFSTEIGAVSDRFRQDFPATYPAESGYTALSVPLYDELTRQARPMLLILIGTTGLVLVIACANVANLTLARMMRRERELALRVAIGAGRARIVRQLLTETTALAVAGGAMGLLLAWQGLDLLVSFATLVTPRTSQISIDAPVLVFTLLVSVASGVAFGVIPALSTRDHLAGSLKESGAQTGESGSRHRFRDILTVAQVAVSFMLLMGAGLLLTSFYRLQQVDPGFNPENVLTAEVFPNWSKYTSTESRLQLFDGVLGRLQGLPGVLSVAAADAAPISGGQQQRQRFEIEGRTYENRDMMPQLEPRTVSHGYFETAGVPLLNGRTFTAADTDGTLRVAVVSRTLAQRGWGDEDPVGQRVKLQNSENWLTIVGVVGDVRRHGLENEPAGELYRPFHQVGTANTILIRARAEPMALAPMVRASVHEVDAEQPVENIRTLDDVQSGTLATRRLTLLLLGVFAVVALVITVTGVSGVMATSVSQRTREFGVRLALGADPAGVLAMVMRRGLGLVGIGLIIGGSGAVMFSRLLETLLYETAPTDPGTFALVSALFLVAGLIACFIPARRAMRVDPMVALRAE